MGVTRVYFVGREEKWENTQIRVWIFIRLFRDRESLYGLFGFRFD